MNLLQEMLAIVEAKSSFFHGTDGTLMMGTESSKEAKSLLKKLADANIDVEHFEDNGIYQFYFKNKADMRASEKLLEKVHTIKNPNIKPRGAPSVKARAFDKVNPKTGARPDRSVLGSSGLGNGKYIALEFADEVDFITVHVVRDDVELRDRAKDPNDNYEGIHVVFTPDGLVSGDTYDLTSKRQWVKDKDKIVAVAKAALKDKNLSGQYDGLMGYEVKRGNGKLSFDTDHHIIDPNKKMHRHRSDEAQSFLKKKPKQIDYKQAHKFAAEVGKLVKSKYRLDDGDDLCFNLVERGDIDMDAGADKAAQIVASHLMQR